ncbi:MAG: M48 family metalloprotease [Burkholderiaceae bacterium]|nr:M48 family metalloprotease [Burkholderiaceae bacterium]
MSHPARQPCRPRRPRRSRRLRTRVLAFALSAALALPAPALHARSALPVLGDSASEDLAVGDERRLGQQIMRSVRTDPLYLDDPMLLEYVQSLWAPLVDAGRRLGHIGDDTDAAFGWELFLVRDRAVNAFALPGGFVGVYLGLVALTASGDELASVLAHELSHVTQRHIARGIGSSQRVGVVATVAMILALLAASRAGNADAAQAAIVGGQAAMLQGQLDFTREMEREADRVGFAMLEAAGFAPQGMASMFERLAFANRLMDDNAFPYLRSHPLTTERIAEARGRLPDAQATHAGSALHALMRARARVLMAQGAEQWHALAADGDEAATKGSTALRPAEAGAAAAAHAQRARWRWRGCATAPASIARRVRCCARRRRLRWTPRRAARRTASPPRPGSPPTRRPRAAAALDEAGAADGRPGRLLQAELAVLRARIEPGAAATAEARRQAEALQVWTAERSDDALAWALLARSARAAGLPLRAQRADAEARAALGDLPGAVDRMRGAQRIAAEAGAGADPIEQQAIDARLRVLQRELDALRAQSREAR